MRGSPYPSFSPAPLLTSIPPQPSPDLPQGLSSSPLPFLGLPGPGSPALPVQDELFPRLAAFLMAPAPLWGQQRFKGRGVLLQYQRFSLIKPTRGKV